MPLDMDPQVSKTKGNEAYRLEDFKNAILHYSTAISNSIDPGDPFFYSNRAQAYLQLSEFELAERDCNEAITLNPSIAKVYFRRANARKAIGGKKSWNEAIQDYKKWQQLATDDKSLDKLTLKTMNDAVKEIEEKIRTNAPAPAQAGTTLKTPGVASTSKAPAAKPVPVVAPLVPASEDVKKSIIANVAAATHAHEELKALWSTKGELIVTRWKDMWDSEVRASMLKGTFAAFGKAKRKKTYPELRAGRMQQGDILLDFISSRASISPQQFAKSLDLNRTRAITLLGAAPATPAPVQLSTIVLLTPEEYGKPVDHHTDNPAAALKTQQKVLDGDACGVSEAVPMFERQVELYRVALQIAKELVLDSKGEPDQELVKVYDEAVKNKVYAGRDGYSTQRVSQTVVTARAYAEDHLDFIKEDPEYVIEAINDRIPATAAGSSLSDPVNANLAKTALKDIALHGYTRQTLWREALLILEDLKTAGDKDQAKALSAVAKVAEFYLEMTFTELVSAVKTSFSKELNDVDEKFEGPDALAAFIDATAEMQGFPALDAKAPRRKARKEPLASAFANLIRLDPKLPTVSTWQILFCLDELAEIFERQSDTKTRLSRKLVEVLGEYTDAVELREILPAKLSRDVVPASTFFASVYPLWEKLERAWNSGVSLTTAGVFFTGETAESLQAVWTAFDAEIAKTQKKKSSTLEKAFEGLLTKKVERHEENLLICKPPAAKLQLDAQTDYDSDDSRAPSSEAGGSDDESDFGGSTMSSLESASDDESVVTVESDESRPSTPTKRSAKKVRSKGDSQPRGDFSSGPGPSHSSFTNSQGIASAYDTESEDEFGSDLAAKVKKLKIKTRKERDGNLARRQAESEAATEGTEDSIDELYPLADWTFKVNSRAYETFEKYLGGNAGRTDVAWSEFTYAMNSIGWTAVRGAGSAWKFKPRGFLRLNESIVFHEPHPESTQRPNQIAWTGKRLRRMYGMKMSMFVVE